VQYDAVRDPRISVSRLPTSVYVKPLRPVSADIVSGAMKADTTVELTLSEAAKNLSVHIRMNQKCSKFPETHLTMKSTDASLSTNAAKISVISHLENVAAIHSSRENLQPSDRSLQFRSLMDKSLVSEPLADESRASEIIPSSERSGMLIVNPCSGVVVKQEISHCFEATGNDLPDIQATEALLNRVVASRVQGQLVHQVPSRAIREDRPKHLAGISPDVLKRRLERIEAKLSAIRSKNRMAGSSSKDTTMSFKQMESEVFDTEVKNLLASCIASTDELSSVRSQSVDTDTPINRQVSVAENTSVCVDINEHAMLPDTTTTALRTSALDPKACAQLLSPNIPSCGAKNSAEQRIEALRYPGIAVNKRSVTADSPDSTITEMLDTPGDDLLNTKSSLSEKPKVTQTQELDEPQLSRASSGYVESKIGDLESVSSSHLGTSCSSDKGRSGVGSLSVETQWDSESFESRQVRDTHKEFIRGWRSSKPLDQLVSGQLMDKQVENKDNVKLNSVSSVVVAVTADSALREVQNRLGEISNLSVSTEEPVDKSNLADFKSAKSCLEDELVMEQSSNVATVCYGTISDISDNEDCNTTNNIKKKARRGKASDQSQIVVSTAFSGLVENLEMIRNAVCTEDNLSDTSKQLHGVSKEGHPKIQKTCSDLSEVNRESIDSSNQLLPERKDGKLGGELLEQELDAGLLQSKQVRVHLGKKQVAEFNDKIKSKITNARHEVGDNVGHTKDGDNQTIKGIDDASVQEKEKKKSKKSHKQRESDKEHRKHKKKKRHNHDYEAHYLEVNADIKSKVSSKDDNIAKKGLVKRRKIDDDKVCQRTEPSDEEASDTVLQCFVSGDVDLKALSRIPEIAENVRNFHSRSLTLQTSFFWAVALAVLDRFIDDPELPLVDGQSKNDMECQQDEGIRNGTGLCKPIESNLSIDSEHELNVGLEISGTRLLVKSVKTDSSVISALGEVCDQFMSLYKQFGVSEVEGMPTGQSYETISFSSRLHHLNMLSFTIDDAYDPVVLPGIQKFDCGGGSLKGDCGEAANSEQMEFITESCSKRVEVGYQKKNTHSKAKMGVAHENVNSSESLTAESVHMYETKFAKRSRLEDTQGEQKSKIQNDKDVQLLRFDKLDSCDADHLQNRLIKTRCSVAEKLLVVNSVDAGKSVSSYANEKCVERKDVESRKRRHGSESIVHVKQEVGETKQDAVRSDVAQDRNKQNYDGDNSSKTFWVSRNKHEDREDHLQSVLLESEKHVASKISECNFHRKSGDQDREKKNLQCTDIEYNEHARFEAPSKKLKRSHSRKEDSSLLSNCGMIDTTAGTVTVEKVCSGLVDYESDTTESDLQESSKCVSMNAALKLSSSTSRGKEYTSANKLTSSETTERRCSDSVITASESSSSFSHDTVAVHSNSKMTSNCDTDSTDRKSNLTHYESRDKKRKSGSRNSSVAKDKPRRTSSETSRSVTDRKSTIPNSELRGQNLRLRRSSSSNCNAAEEGCSTVDEIVHTKVTKVKRLEREERRSRDSPCSMGELMDSSSDAPSSVLKISSRLESDDQGRSSRSRDDKNDINSIILNSDVIGNVKKGDKLEGNDISSKHAVDDDVKKRKRSVKYDDDRVSETESDVPVDKVTRTNDGLSLSSLSTNVIAVQSSCTDDLCMKEKQLISCMPPIELSGFDTREAALPSGPSLESSLALETSVMETDSRTSQSPAGDETVSTKCTTCSPVLNETSDKEMSSEIQENKLTIKSASLYSSADGMKFMQTFRRSQIAKRRSQRLIQQTATGGKILMSTGYKPPVATHSFKQKPIGLTLEETLAQFSSTIANTVSPDVKDNVFLVATPVNETSMTWLQPVHTETVSATSPTTSDMTVSPCSTRCEMELTVASSSVSLSFGAPPSGQIMSIVPVVGPSFEPPAYHHDYSMYPTSTDSTQAVSWMGNNQSANSVATEPYGSTDQNMFGYEQNMWSTGLQPTMCHGAPDFNYHWNQTLDWWQAPPPVSVHQDVHPTTEVSEVNVSASWENPLPPPPIPPLTLFSRINISDLVPVPVSIPPLISVSPSANVTTPIVSPIHQSSVLPSTPSATVIPEVALIPAVPITSAAAVKSPLISTLPSLMKPKLSLPCPASESIPRIRNPLPAPPKLRPLPKSVPSSRSPPKLMDLPLRLPVPEPTKSSIIRQRFYILECNQRICETAKVNVM